MCKCQLTSLKVHPSAGPPSHAVKQYKINGCTTQESKVVLDSNWQWTQGWTTDNCFRATIGTRPTVRMSIVPNCAIVASIKGGTFRYSCFQRRRELFVTQGPYSKNVGSTLPPGGRSSTRSSS